MHNSIRNILKKNMIFYFCFVSKNIKGESHQQLCRVELAFQENTQGQISPPTSAHVFCSSGPWKRARKINWQRTVLSLLHSSHVVSQRKTMWLGSWQEKQPAGENCPWLPQIPEDMPDFSGTSHWSEAIWRTVSLRFPSIAEKQGMIWVSGFLHPV